MEQFSNGGRPRRREYSKEFKAQLVAACAQPGASVGGLALSHGLHANMVHRWIREAQTVRTSPRTEAEPSFISLPLTAMAASTRDEQALAALPPPPPSPLPPAVQVRLQRGELVVSLQCPLSQCGALLREVLR
jgi:transposase